MQYIFRNVDACWSTLSNLCFWSLKFYQKRPQLTVATWLLWIFMLLRWEKLYKHWFFSKQHQMALSWIALSSTVKRQRRFWILNMTDNAQWQYLTYQTNSLMQNWTTLYIYIHYWSILFYYFLCTALTIKCIISGHVLSSFTILYTR